MIDLSPEEWVENGYRKCETAGTMFGKHSDFGFQKRFDDEKGKKYFITVYAYDRYQYPPHGSSNYPRFGYCATIQFNHSKQFFNVEMNGHFSIEEVEDHFEKLWVHFGKPYYETWVAD